MFVFTCSRSTLFEFKMPTINTFLPFQGDALTVSNIKYVLQDSLFHPNGKGEDFLYTKLGEKCKIPIFFIFSIA